MFGVKGQIYNSPVVVPDIQEGRDFTGVFLPGTLRGEWKSRTWESEETGGGGGRYDQDDPTETRKQN